MEVAIMDTLTSNIHTLLVPFYRCEISSYPARFSPFSLIPFLPLFSIALRPVAIKSSSKVARSLRIVYASVSFSLETFVLSSVSFHAPFVDFNSCLLPILLYFHLILMFHSTLLQALLTRAISLPMPWSNSSLVKASTLCARRTLSQRSKSSVTPWPSFSLRGSNIKQVPSFNPSPITLPSRLTLTFNPQP